MEVFLSLLLEITPLYIFIIVGFVAGKYANLSKESVSLLSIYFLVPCVMFYGVMQAEFSAQIVVLPLIVFAISTFACFILYNIGKRFLDNKTQANILALAAGTSNSGYYGIPVAIILFEPHIVGVYVTAVLGKVIFQNSVGFYMTALGNYSAKESLKKLLTLPPLYAFILAVILQFYELKIPEFLDGFFVSVKGAYTFIGMMIIGVGISQIARLSLDVKFTSVALFGRMILWPLLAFAVYMIDQSTFGLIGEGGKKALLLASLVPLAADTVAIASILKCHPEEMGTAVLISSVIALIYVPLMISLFI